jgi:hypothetical protein
MELWSENPNEYGQDCRSIRGTYTQQSRSAERTVNRINKTATVLAYAE